MISDTYGRRVLLRFAVTEFLFFAFGSLLSYQTVFLKDVLDLPSASIGSLTAICAIISLAFIPLWGVLSDKLRSARVVFGLCMAGASIATLLFSFLGAYLAATPALIFSLLLLKYLFQQPTNSLLDGWAISALAPCGIDYSRARVWGSAGFASFCLLLGLTVGKVISIQTAFQLCAGLGLALAAWTLVQRDGHIADSGKKPNRSDFFQLIRNKKFLMYLLFSIGPNIFVGVTLVYFPFVLEQVDVSANRIGIFTGLRSVVEVLTMLILVALLSKKINVGYLVVLPGIFGGIEHLLYGSAPGAAAVFASMTFSGLAGGVFYSLGPAYIHSIVPVALQNTAQTLAAFITTLVAVGGSYLGGRVIARFGVLALTRGCGVLMLLLSTVFLLSHAFWRTPFFRKAV